MKRSFIAPALFALLFSHPSHAEDVYYVELGSAPTQEEALLQWKALSGKFPGLLGGLTYYPTPVIQKNTNTMTMHVQAGPLHTKLDAYHICGELFDHHVPCFIVEGMEHEAPAQQAEAAEQAPVVLPWLVEDSRARADANMQPPAADEMASEKEEMHDEGGFFSWIGALFGMDDEEEAHNYSKADVEVSEAIRVPLTPREERRIEVRPLAPWQHARAGDEAIPAGAGWLNIGKFDQEGSASAFWQDARRQDPEHTAGLRVRVLKPLMERGGPDVSLNVGPFAGYEDAMAFCQRITGEKHVLHCAFTAEEPRDMAASKLTEAPFSHARRYNARRRAVRLHNGYRERGMVEQAKPVQVYWLQVATADTQMEALKAWDALREQNADLLEGIRSSVSATMGRMARYAVRIGPLDSNSAAVELCSSLSRRGVACQVFSNM